MFTLFGQVHIFSCYIFVALIKLYIYADFHLSDPVCFKINRFLVKFESILAKSKIPIMRTSAIFDLNDLDIPSNLQSFISENEESESATRSTEILKFELMDRRMTISYALKTERY